MTYVLSGITHPPLISHHHPSSLFPLHHPFTPSPPHTPQEDEEDSGEEVDLSKYDLTGDDDEEERKGDNDSKEESKWVECVCVCVCVCVM